MYFFYDCSHYDSFMSKLNFLLFFEKSPTKLINLKKNLNQFQWGSLCCFFIRLLIQVNHVVRLRCQFNKIKIPYF